MIPIVFQAYIYYIKHFQGLPIKAFPELLRLIVPCSERRFLCRSKFLPLSLSASRYTSFQRKKSVEQLYDN